MAPDYYDYGDDVPLPSPEQTKSLADLIKNLYDAEVAVEVANAELAARKQAVSELEHHHIPDLMREMRVESFGAGGLKVALVKDYWCGITEDRRAAAHKWLRENKEGGLIKSEVKVPFAMGQEAEAAKLVKELGERFPGNVAQSEAVHPQSLKAFVRRRMEANDAGFPADLFGAQEFQKAKIERPKKQKNDKDTD